MKVFKAKPRKSSRQVEMRRAALQVTGLCPAEYICQGVTPTSWRLDLEPHGLWKAEIGLVNSKASTGSIERHSTTITSPLLLPPPPLPSCHHHHETTKKQRISFLSRHYGAHLQSQHSELRRLQVQNLTGVYMQLWNRLSYKGAMYPSCIPRPCLKISKQIELSSWVFGR